MICLCDLRLEFQFDEKRPLVGGEGKETILFSKSLASQGGQKPAEGNPANHARRVTGPRRAEVKRKKVKVKIGKRSYGNNNGLTMKGDFAERGRKPIRESAHCKIQLYRIESETE